MDSKTAVTATPMAIRKSGKKRASINKLVFVLCALGPAYIAYVVFGLYPNALSIYYSFLDWDGISPATFVGLKNFKMMLEDPFVWRALSHNLIMMCITPPVIMLVSLLLAYLLTYKSFTENHIYKVLYFFPNILSTVVIALLWSFIFDGSFGVINTILNGVGINVGELYWLGDERTALGAVMVPVIWCGVGFYVVIFMNAMKSIPQSLYESAILDGATHMQRLFKITLPLIKGVINVGILFTVLGALRGFDMILVLTQGGPSGATDVIGLYMFSQAFSTSTTNNFGGHQFGYASAIGMFLFVILVAAKLLIDKFFKNDSVEY